MIMVMMIIYCSLYLLEREKQHLYALMNVKVVGLFHYIFNINKWVSYGGNIYSNTL